MKRSFSGGVWRNWNAIETEGGQLETWFNEWLLVSETHRQASASHTSLQLSHISQSRLQLRQANEKRVPNVAKSEIMWSAADKRGVGLEVVAFTGDKTKIGLASV